MTASVDTITDRLAHIIDSFVWSGGSDGVVIAAMAVLADPEISRGLSDTELIEQLEQDHQWRYWDDGLSRTCSCGAGACKTRAVLDARR